MPTIVHCLVSRFGVTRIILFGSIINGRFGPESDIDLAVAGLARRDFFPALAEVNQLTPFRVDLKPLEDLEAHFRERVLRSGECLYETASDRVARVSE